MDSHTTKPLALTMASATSSLVLGPDYVLGLKLGLSLTLMTPKIRRRKRSLASRQHRNQNESMMIRRMILTTMILLLLRNASVDVGPMRSRHIFVAIVLVMIRDAMPLNVMHWRTPIIMKTMSIMVPSLMNRRWMTMTMTILLLTMYLTTMMMGTTMRRNTMTT